MNTTPLENGGIWPVVKEADLVILDKLELTEEQARAILQECKDLLVKDHTDLETYESVKAKHIILKNVTSRLDERRKEITAPARDYVNKVNGYAKKLEVHLAAAKIHLQSQRQIVEEYEENRKKEKQREEERLVLARKNELHRYGAEVPEVLLYNMSEEKYNEALNRAKLDHAELVKKQNEEKAKLQKLERENRALVAQIVESKKVKLLEEIRAEFDTLEKCWAEIYKLRTETF